ncbi:MAG: hypothetical protein IRZ16_02305 [Myxococcaceae bacterium]|nr:hypothetical protein [Myxococcaceae bacterium]
MPPEIEIDDTFHPSEVEIWLLMILSVCWIGFFDRPVIPIGLIATLYYVGRNFETTVLASWRKGWRIVLGSVGITLVSWFAASASLNISDSYGGLRIGLLFQLARWVDWLS